MYISRLQNMVYTYLAYCTSNLQILHNFIYIFLQIQKENIYVAYGLHFRIFCLCTFTDASRLFLRHVDVRLQCYGL